MHACTYIYPYFRSMDLPVALLVWHLMWTWMCWSLALIWSLFVDYTKCLLWKLTQNHWKQVIIQTYVAKQPFLYNVTSAYTYICMYVLRMYAGMYIYYSTFCGSLFKLTSYYHMSYVLFWICMHARFFYYVCAFFSVHVHNYFPSEESRLESVGSSVMDKQLWVHSAHLRTYVHAYICAYCVLVKSV